jgi:hypothetical protein
MMSDLGEVTNRIDIAPAVVTHTCEDAPFTNPVPEWKKVVEFVSKQLLIGDSAKSHGVIRTGHPDPVGAAPVRGEGEDAVAVGGGDEDDGESESSDSDAHKGGDGDDGGHLEGGNEPTQPFNFFTDGDAEGEAEDEAEDEADGVAMGEVNPTADDGPHVVDPNTFE